MQSNELLAELDPFRDPDLASVIEGHIDLRTGGRIHGLEVDVMDRRVFVHGCSNSYHTKQIAQEAVLEMLLSNDPKQVEIDIEVTGDGSRR